MAQGKTKQPIGEVRPVALRFFPEETAALEQIALAEDRTIASLCRRIVREWMRQQGINPTKAPK